jgi:peptidoglycan biosynthesis protein MviN/MurJ (putative lipid II flippase)
MKNSVFDIKRPHFPVLVTLVSIIVVGLIGIPFGDPRFIAYAIFLELVYVSLAILVAKGYRKPLYVCILIAIIIIVGNSFVNAHINRIMTMSRPLNTMVLIVGGYLLQGLLVYTSAMALRKSNGSKSRTQ